MQLYLEFAPEPRVTTAAFPEKEELLQFTGGGCREPSAGWKATD
jgi:hypothetical protein